VPAEKETIDSENSDLLANTYTETVVTVGTEAYPLEGYLAMPDSTSAQNPVPACVFVHDFGAYDRDLTLGNTAMFKDLAEEFAEMGIIPQGAYRNMDYVGDNVMISDEVPQPIQDIIADPQTSGGLMISIPEKFADDIIFMLEEVTPWARIIGQVSAKEDVALKIK